MTAVSMMAMPMTAMRVTAELMTAVTARAIRATQACPAADDRKAGLMPSRP
jgi:hypothetical protein